METNYFTNFHEISPMTMAVVSGTNEYGHPISYIIEETEEYISNNTPSKIIDAACKFFGSNLKGRQAGTRTISGLTHKVPISIDPASGMYFFPTYSPLSPKCSWIAHSHVKQVKKALEGKSEILFQNGKTITLDVSYGSLVNQIHRTAQYRYLLDNRIKKLKEDMIAEKITPINHELHRGKDSPRREEDSPYREK